MPKMSANLYVIEDYENETPSGPKKQTQFKPNFERPKSLAKKSGHFNKPKKNSGQSRMKWLELQFWMNCQFEVRVN